MVREALFNILGPAVLDCRFTDLFSGTGAVGLEALSRGAARVTMVERSHDAIRVIKRNLALLECDQRARLVCEDVYAYRDFGQEDFIFTSPPYPEIGRIPNLARRLSELVSPDAWWILQHPKSFNIKELEQFWRLDDSRVYGSNSLSFFQIMAKEEISAKSE
jgi:16S rRNA (guanine(966)-N(2))-methyltransferase RsmD